MNAHELDRTGHMCAALEVDSLLHRNRRTDAAPDDDDLAEWGVAAWFCTGYAAVMGLVCWIAFTPTGRDAFNALREWLA